MITFEHVTVSYPRASRPAISDVNLELDEGAFALVVGPSGGGKSTLLRCINGLVPHFSGGAMEGRILVDGLDPIAATPQVMSRHVGFVFQDPEAQFVVDRVEAEVAFALENAALPRPEIQARVDHVLDLLGLLPLRRRRLETLSGGEKQRVAIAAALALRPRIMVLDEPTSQLDPQSADDVLQALVRLNGDLGLTIVLVEHRLERVIPYADVLIHVPADGVGVSMGPPRQVLRRLSQVPPLVALGKALDWSPLPLTIEEGLVFGRKMVEGLPTSSENASPARDDSPHLQAEDVQVSYGGEPAVRGASLKVWPGEVVALMGENGAGKTSLLKCLVGLIRPNHGSIRVRGEDIARQDVASICRHVGYLPQNPNSLLFADSVTDELEVTLRNHARGDRAKLGPDAPSRIAYLLGRLGLAGKAGAYPRDLSTGERQRVALGAIVVPGPGALLLDEPTRGLDYGAKEALVDLLASWCADGMAIVLVTHDVEMAAAAASRVVVMKQGQIIADGSPSQVLGGSPIFEPQTSRLFPGTGWLSPSDALRALRKA